MEKFTVLFTGLLMIMFNSAYSQKPDKVSLAAGMNFIQTKMYSAEDDAKIFMKIWAGLSIKPSNNVLNTENDQLSESEL
jgi:hypothetical protein